MNKTAVITGITGQDGSYLAELLLSKDYVIHGVVRRSSNIVRERLEHLTSQNDIYKKRLWLHYSDLDDNTTIRRLLTKIAPDEIYHLAGQSHVGLSYEIPESTCEFAAMGTLRMLELIRDLPRVPKFLNVGSSELFGKPDQSPQNEDTPFNPISPYGVAKAFAVRMVDVYRDAHGIFACNAICYNHESPRRGHSFVTRKITSGVAAIASGQASQLTLGNLNSRRDWGFAPEYVDGMWRMMQHDTPGNFILATGVQHSIEDFLELAFHHVGLDWRKYVSSDSKYLRPNEVERLVGDASKAKRLLGWKPSVALPELVAKMVDHDLSELNKSNKELSTSRSVV